MSVARRKLLRPCAWAVVAGAVVAVGAPRLEAVAKPAGSAPERAGFAPKPTHFAPRRADFAPKPTHFAPERADFAVRFHEIITPYRVFLLTALPGEPVKLETVDDGRAPAQYVVEAGHGPISRDSDGSWTWRAPTRPGAYRITIRRTPVSGAGGAGAHRPTSVDMITLNAVVLVPMEQLHGGEIYGYRVGDFPRTPYRNLPQYLPPRGFIPLMPNADLQVSPHFSLSQFPCKGPPGYPKYVVLSERLLLKLELLLERTNAAGIDAPTFQVLSGFRSPWYNAGIGRPRYSRHIYGDAADIYVDNDGDGRMDDLNGDGRIDLADATILHQIVERMDAAPETARLIGGLGQYPTTPNHGPFIHVDTREYRARW